jgi:hypothetical protein
MRSFVYAKSKLKLDAGFYLLKAKLNRDKSMYCQLQLNQGKLALQHLALKEQSPLDREHRRS